MAKYVFLNMPAYGHVNPTLAVVQELVSRGQEVSYYLTEEFRNAIEATGATFQPYESQMKGSPAAMVSGSGEPPLARIGAMMAEEARSVPPQVIDRIRAEQPAVILYDFMCVWAKTIIEELDVPAISVRATYASNEHFKLFDLMRANAGGNSHSPTHPMASLFGSLTRVEPLNIVFIPREFQPEGETFDERFLFVGPPITPRHQATAFPFDQLKGDLPLLYISLGSIFTNQPAFYRMCFEAFGDQPWQVVLSVGKQTDLTQIGTVPDNFLLSSYVPQLEILPRTQVFVTHAGTNSVMESMYYGVPMVLIPQQPEQQFHARRTEELGAGLMLAKENVSASQLRETVARVAQNSSYREHAQHMQKVIHAAGGQQRAVDAIIQFAATHGKQESSRR